MTEGTLFNPGFLGASFNWWVGQVADDSTWRDNIIPGKFESKDSPKGWGYRYKVRIIGLHDKEEETVPSDQLPWAQVMYPITGGGGQAQSAQMPAIRQGNFVFGFFLDGQEMQVPVIMGILGNNVQTPLSTKIGTNSSNFAGTSGFAQGKEPDPNIKAPDHALGTEKPKSAEQSKECAPAPPGTKTNSYGLRSDLPLTSTQFKDAQSARSEADARGLTGSARDNFVQQKVADGISNRCAEASSPTSPSQPGATVEDVTAVHLVTISDVKRQDKYLKKIVLMSPCDFPGSAMKAIQTAIENLTSGIDKILQSAQSYIDAASSIISSIQNLVANFACEIAKYMKIIFDKIFEYVIKTINKALAPTVDLLYPNERNKYSDLKDTLTELLKCLYSKLTDSLCGNIQAVLDDIFKTDPASTQKKIEDLKKEEEERRKSGNKKVDKAPSVPPCTMEKFIGDVLGANLSDINAGVDDSLSIIGTFLEDTIGQNTTEQKSSGSGVSSTDSDSNILNDIQGGLDTAQDALSTASGAISAASGAVSGASSFISGLTGSLSSALSFENIKINVFGCDLKPTCPATDYYTLQNGGSAAPKSSQPKMGNVAQAAQNPSTIPPATDLPPFATPSTTQADVNFGTRDEAIEAINSGAVVFA